MRQPSLPGGCYSRVGLQVVRGELIRLTRGHLPISPRPLTSCWGQQCFGAILPNVFGQPGTLAKWGLQRLLTPVYKPHTRELIVRGETGMPKSPLLWAEVGRFCVVYAPLDLITRGEMSGGDHLPRRCGHHHRQN